MPWYSFFPSIVTSNLPVSFETLLASVHITEHLVKIFSQAKEALRFSHIHLLMHHFDTLNTTAITFSNFCWSFRTTEHKLSLISHSEYITVYFGILVRQMKSIPISTTSENQTTSRNSAFPLSFISCQTWCQSYQRIWDLANCYVLKIVLTIKCKLFSIKKVFYKVIGNSFYLKDSPVYLVPSVGLLKTL